jgi:murein DD-endopeptidase MepM/ murein hydrolase activator NlpD
MKTNNSSQRTKNVITTAGVFLAAALVIVLSIVFALNASTTIESVEPVNTVSKPVVEKYSIPVENYTLGKAASIDKLVYMPSLNMWKTHNGVDFAAAEGSKVNAAYSGKVTAVETSALDGTTVTVSQSDGLTAIYKSLSSSSVKVGDKVANGAQIGVVGTMISETEAGAHLHFELKKDGKFVDPLDYIDVEGAAK